MSGSENVSFFMLLKEKLKSSSTTVITGIKKCMRKYNIVDPRCGEGALCEHFVRRNSDEHMIQYARETGLKDDVWEREGDVLIVGVNHSIK